MAHLNKHLHIFSDNSTVISYATLTQQLSDHWWCHSGLRQGLCVLDTLPGYPLSRTGTQLGRRLGCWAWSTGDTPDSSPLRHPRRRHLSSDLHCCQPLFWHSPPAAAQWVVCCLNGSHISDCGAIGTLGSDPWVWAISIYFNLLVLIQAHMGHVPEYYYKMPTRMNASYHEYIVLNMNECVRTWIRSAYMNECFRTQIWSAYIN